MILVPIRRAAPPAVRRLCAATLLAALGASGGCRKAPPTAKATLPGADAVATVGDKTITAADVRARLAEQPSFAVARYKSPEHKKELVEAMIRSELLVDEARRRGLDKDPEVRAAVEKVLVNKLTQSEAQDADKKDPVSEGDARRYYEDHISEFSSPLRVRVAHLFLACAEKEPCRATAPARASHLLDEIKRKETAGAKQGFELTASQQSEDAVTKATGGDLGFKTQEDLGGFWGAPLAQAAIELTSTGQIGPVVSTNKGLHLIKLLGRQEGYKTPFEAARSRIEARLSVDRRTRVLDRLAAELRGKANVRIDDAALARIDVDKRDDAAPDGGHR